MTPPALAQNNQYKRTLLQLRSKGDLSLEKYIFLSSLKQYDEDMYVCFTPFYRLPLIDLPSPLLCHPPITYNHLLALRFYAILMANMPEICPLIYTPTVGEACLEFSHIYRKPEGLVRYMLPFEVAHLRPTSRDQCSLFIPPLICI
jgi:malate dehydrogenase (oxaloacetate-decarboxylating)(NADP+)